MHLPAGSVGRVGMVKKDYLGLIKYFTKYLEGIEFIFYFVFQSTFRNEK